jgi:hypothetical protein
VLPAVSSRPTCQSCGKEQKAAGYRFCTGCGAAPTAASTQAPPPIPAAPAAISAPTCQSCGKEHTTAFKFCTGCGTAATQSPAASVAVAGIQFGASWSQFASSSSEEEAEEAALVAPPATGSAGSSRLEAVQAKMQAAMQARDHGLVVALMQERARSAAQYHREYSRTIGFPSHVRSRIFSQKCAISVARPSGGSGTHSDTIRGLGRLQVTTGGAGPVAATLSAEDEVARVRAEKEVALRAELAPLMLSGFKKLARSNGMKEEEVDDVDDADDPKAAIIELLMAATAVTWAVEAKAMASTRPRAEKEAALRAELGLLMLSGLKKRARSEGVGAEEVDDVDDTGDPKAAIIELLVARPPHDSRPCTPVQVYTYNLLGNFFMKLQGRGFRV